MPGRSPTVKEGLVQILVQPSLTVGLPPAAVAAATLAAAKLLILQGFRGCL